MDPQPRDEMRGYEGRGLLAGKRALITGGDSGIGRAVAVAFAKEGADVAIAYLSEQEDQDARHTAELIEKAGHRCVTLRGDLAEEANCQRAVDQAVHELGGLDILVNNVATQQPVQDFAELTTGQWDRTFKVNIYSYFWTTKAAYPHLPDGGAVINTASINGLRGNKTLIDYSATKGSDPGPHLLPGPGLPGPWHPGQQRRAGPGVDATDPGHLRRGQGQQLRRPGADGTRRAPRRDRPVVRVLRGRPDVELLLRRGAGPGGRRNHARLSGHQGGHEWSVSYPTEQARVSRRDWKRNARMRDRVDGTGASGRALAVLP